MGEKIKILSVGKAKKEVKKTPKGAFSVQDYIEQAAPGMYTFIKAYIEDTIKMVETLRPEIIWIHQEQSMDCSNLVKEIKRIHPAAAIFMMLIGAYEDEQEMSDTYTALGAYKCYFIPPLMLDILVHDMHVALNME